MILSFRRLAMLLTLVQVFVFTVSLDAQVLLPGLDPVNTIQKDSTSFYFNKIWLQSKDINNEDIDGFLQRASSKIGLGYFSEALADVNRAIELAPELSYCYLLRGYISMMTGLADAALGDFRKTLSLNDTSVAACYYSAGLYTGMGHYAEADSLYRRALKIDPTFVHAGFGLANLYILEFKYGHAENQLKKVIDLDPGFAPAYLNIAVLNLHTAQAKALRYLNKAIEADSSFAQAYFLKGYIEMRSGRTGPGLKDLDRAAEIDSMNVMYRISVGFYRIGNDDLRGGFDEILRVIPKADLDGLARNFDNSPASQHLRDFLLQARTFREFSGPLGDIEKDALIKGICYFFTGRYDRSELIYRRWAEGSSAPALVFYLRGFNMEYFENYSASLDYYRRALEFSPCPDDVLLRMGYVLNVTGKPMDALKYLGKYTSEHDDSWFAHNLLAAVYFRLGRYGNALAGYNRILKIDSMDLKNCYNRGECFKKLGRMREAGRDFQRVARYKPFDIGVLCEAAECSYNTGDTLEAYNMLTKTYYRYDSLTETGYYIRGSIDLYYQRYDTAISDFTRLLKHNPRHLDGLIYRAISYYSLREYEKAKADLDLALKINNNEITALYTRGMVYIAQDAHREAFADLSKAEKLGHPFAKRAIQAYLKEFMQTEPQGP